LVAYGVLTWENQLRPSAEPGAPGRRAGRRALQLAARACRGAGMAWDGLLDARARFVLTRLVYGGEMVVRWNGMDVHGS